MRQIGYVLLGWLLGVLSMLIGKWLQTREERRKKEIDILSGALAYVFGIRQTLNNLVTDRQLLAEVRNVFPDKAPELQKKMYARFDDEISKDFFPNLMIQSFHLKRLEDKTFWKDFESLMNKFEELGKMTMGATEIAAIQEFNKGIMDTMKSFVEKCLAKAKV